MLWTGVLWTGVLWTGVLWTGVLWTGGLWTGVLCIRVLWTGVLWTGVLWTGVLWTGVPCGPESPVDRSPLWTPGWTTEPTEPLHSLTHALETVLLLIHAITEVLMRTNTQLSYSPNTACLWCLIEFSIVRL